MANTIVSNGVQIITNYCTLNPCYSKPTTINVLGFVWHSVGTAGVEDANSWRNRWNRADIQTSVSAVCDPEKVVIMLPCMETKGKAYKNWGVGTGTSGRSENSSRIQLEMAETKYIKYTGGASFTFIDRAKAVEFTKGTIASAIEFFAQACVFHGIDPLGKDKYGNPTIMSHAECYKAGTGSNHGDIEHLLRQMPELGYTMDILRQKVADRVNEIKQESEVPEFLTNYELFKQYMNQYLTEIQNVAQSSWSEKDMQWAKDNGIMVGDTNGNMMPKGWITREQMVVVLHRYHEKKDSLPV